MMPLLSRIYCAFLKITFSSLYTTQFFSDCCQMREHIDLCQCNADLETCLSCLGFMYIILRKIICSYYFIRNQSTSFWSSAYQKDTKDPAYQFANDQVGRQVYFIVIQIYKKTIYNIVKELRNTIKKSMTTGIAQKSYYFHFGPLGKMIHQKIKDIYKEETQKALKGILNT